MFNEDFKHGKTFTVNSDNFPFVNIKEIAEENGIDKVLKVQGVFTFKGKKGKLRPVLIADGHKINLPDHMLKDIQKLLSKHEYIQAVNDGKCGFQITTYEDTEYGNGTCYSGIFVDI